MKRTKLIFTFLSALLLTLALPNQALAETKTLNCTQDTYANEAYPDKVNGGVSSVIISNKYTTRLGYFLFEDPNLPAGAIIDSATLRLNLSEVHYADNAKVNVGPVNENWLETSITWNTKPTIDQTQATEATLVITDTGWRNIGVKALVEKWQDGSLENYGLFVYPYGFLYGAAESEYAIAAKSQEAGSDPAEIVIEYHLPSPTPTETTPSPEPTPETESDLASTTGTLSPEASPTPFESIEKATPADDEGGFKFSMTTGQMIIVGLIGLSLLGAIIAFTIYFAKQPKKEKPKKKKSKKKREKDQEQEQEEEDE